MGNNHYLDIKLINKYPNKYNLTPKNIKTLKVLDWDKLKKKTWFNEAMYLHNNKDIVWCHIEGCGKGYYGDYFSEFWIGFYEDGRVNCNFSCNEGMCSYNFEKFYNINEIEDKWDMEIQVKAIKWLNMMIDEGILSL